MEKNNKIKVVENVPLEPLIKPIKKFFQIQASGGILLLIVTVVALIWANSSFSDYYFGLWDTKMSITIGEYFVNKSLLIWINDGLMAIFFFLVGLEIKRELLIGELTSFKKASLPFFAAIGGMMFPALIYVLFNFGTDKINGWGIAVATDIAFSLGILSLLSTRIPNSLKIFLTAFAIIDDIGAVIVISLFYTSDLVVFNLIIALSIFLILIIFNVLHIRKPLIYIITGSFMWYFFLYSGIHPTVAGILLAFTIPTVARIDYKNFFASTKKSITELEKSTVIKNKDVSTPELNTLVFTLERKGEKVLAPAHRIEHNLHKYVAYFIIPLFALANAGVKIEGSLFKELTNPITFAIILGLFFGNQIGITLFSYIAVKTKISSLPRHASFKQIYGIACLGGIGFTMSLFIASLAFDNPQYLNNAKIGILAGSLIAGITGYITLLIFDIMAKRKLHSAP